MTKKRVVAKAQKIRRRNREKHVELLASQTLRRAKVEEEQKLRKNPNRKLRRFWNKVSGKERYT
ncbi:hypothetical protein LCGC14_0611090 [marine sediment metagenome]|uniref:Uncharacterized protein n=1 Tax=marine sediment metagenome TaxID=412755 RepID=A0A0F9RRU0_9ZZZZ